MATVLIADEQTLCRDLMAAMLTKEGYRCATTGSGQEAWEQVREGGWDLIVTETDLTGMAGLDLVERVRENLKTRSVPVIILTNSHDKARVTRGAAMGIHGYFLKNQLSVERLLSRIRELIGEAGGGEGGSAEAAPIIAKNAVAEKKAAPAGSANKQKTAATATPKTAAAARFSSCAPPPARGKPGVPLPGRPAEGQLPHLLTREQTILRLDQVAGSKTIAGVVAQVIALANSPEADLGDMVRVLESDPVLATRVLQAANSASAGVRTRIRTVEEGVRTLGVREIRNLALTVGIFGSFPPNEADGFNSLRCWQHSFAVADLIGLLAHEHDHYQASVNHLVGLCHDLGEILLRQHFPEEYRRILEYALVHRMPVHEVENVALAIRHPELLSRLLSRIGLPQPVVHAIREFYERQVKGQAAGMSKEARVLTMANQVAYGMLLAASTQAAVGPINGTEWRALGTNAQPPAINAVSKRNEILCATNVLARLSEKDEKSLVAPLLPQTAKCVWYARPETFIALDPLGMALSMMSDVTVSSALPSGAQWQKIDGLVTVGMRVGAPPIIREELERLREEGGRRDLPLLILAGQDVIASQSDNVMIKQYPIALAELNEWLSLVKAREMAIAV
jgi:HD-like signal output (HDOD) protein/DNA-binding response OmpR family regulator